MHPDSGRSSKVASRLPSLAARAQLGDRSALEQLLGALEWPLLDHVKTIVADQDVADDVLQETLLRVSRSLGSLREPEWIRAWVYRIATREAIRAARAERDPRRAAVDDWHDLAVPEAESADASEELLDVLPAHLDELPRQARLVVRMRYLQELSQREIAEALEIPIGTVKSRLNYGLAILRRTMNRGV